MVALLDDGLGRDQPLVARQALLAQGRGPGAGGVRAQRDGRLGGSLEPGRPPRAEGNARTPPRAWAPVASRVTSAGAGASSRSASAASSYAAASGGARSASACARAMRTWGRPRPPGARLRGTPARRRRLREADAQLALEAARDVPERVPPRPRSARFRSELDEGCRLTLAEESLSKNMGSTRRRTWPRPASRRP